MGAMLPLQAHRRRGEGREGTERWADDSLAEGPGHRCGASGVRGRGRGLSTWARQTTSRRVEARERDERPPGRHTVPQRFDGAGTREVEEAPLLILLDLRCHFAAGENDRRGLGLSARGLLERRGAPGLMQDIGGTRQEKPQSVREAGGG
jgi:hypothetical protein